MATQILRGSKAKKQVASLLNQPRQYKSQIIIARARYKYFLCRMNASDVQKAINKVKVSKTARGEKACRKHGSVQSRFDPGDRSSSHF